MTISNALPIQFWPEGTPTFNELDVCGINNVCFCQPVQCDDEILIQFTDSTISAATLKVLDPDGTVLLSEAFGEVADVFTLYLTPSDEEICDEVVVFLIETSTDDAAIFDVHFPATLLPFYNDGTGDESWYHDVLYGGGANIEFDPASVGATSTNLVIDFAEQGVGFYRVDSTLFWLTLTGSTDLQITVKITIAVYLDDVLVMTVLELTNTTPVSASDGDIVAVSATSFTSIAPFNKLVITAEVTNVEPGATVTYAGVNDITLTKTSRIGFKSDCIDVRTEHECTKLITYSNNSDFAGIDYNAASPSPEFNLRVPAMLFRATRPQEQEVHPLSNDEWIRVWSRMTKKMRLELGFMPDYMHEKLQLILMHDNVEIDGLSWKHRDPYELGEGSKRNPLMVASTLLTDKTFIKRNLI